VGIRITLDAGETLSFSPYILLSYLSILLIVYISTPFYISTYHSQYIIILHHFSLYNLPFNSQFLYSLSFAKHPIFPYPYDNLHKSLSIPCYPYLNSTFTFLLIIYHTNLSQTQQYQYLYRLILNIFLKCTIIFRVMKNYVDF
jgi:hypothetical protein